MTIQQQPSCIFCNAANKPKDFTIVYQDELVVAFKDNHPVSQLLHLQIVPHRHIRSIKELTHTDTYLVEHMRLIGHHLLQEHGYASSQARLGFHRPPFISVPHLHMHCIVRPFSPWWRALKFVPNTPWYLSADRCIRQLKMQL